MKPALLLVWPFKIPLRGKYGKGKFALVDKEDFEIVNQYKWCVDVGYAEHTINKPYKKLYMHRLIANTPDGMETDHINGDRLDNRKKNLRICTRTQNIWNNGPIKGYKGVDFKKDHNKYRSTIRCNGKYIHLGYFNTEIEAAKAYNEAAKKYFGEYARLNRIGGGVDV